MKPYKLKPYKAPRRVKGKRTNKLQIMDHGGSKVYRQGSLEVEERRSYSALWLSVIPPHQLTAGWWQRTYVVPRAPELVILAFLARYKNYDWQELLDISEELQRTFEQFEKGGY